jgi:hypothetical protein
VAGMPGAVAEVGSGKLCVTAPCFPGCEDADMVIGLANLSGAQLRHWMLGELCKVVTSKLTTVLGR